MSNEQKVMLQESGFLVCIDKSQLTESALIERAGKRLIVRGVPATNLDVKNANGRIYSRKEMQTALDKGKQFIEQRRAICTADDHPAGTHVPPSKASHVVIEAYIKDTAKGPVLFNDWEILETSNGKDLRALIDANVSIGTSIRGLGNMKNENVVNYEYLGTDVVGNPSSGTFTLTTEDLGVKVTVEAVEDPSNKPSGSESDTSLIESKGIDMNEAREKAVAALAAAKESITNFRESNPTADINAVTQKIVSTEMSLVTDHLMTNDLMEDWRGFKNTIMGEAPKPEQKTESTGLTEAELRDQNVILERQVAAGTQIQNELRESLNAARTEAAELRENADSGLQLLESALGRLKALQEEHGGKTKAEYEADVATATDAEKAAAKEAADAEKTRVIAETTKLIEEIMEEYRRQYKKVEARYEVCAQMGDKITEHFHAMRAIATELAETLRTKFAEKDQVTESIPLTGRVARKRFTS